jgi:hypothetical protein
MTEIADVTRWVEAYRTAWTTNDANDIGLLFTDDAVYEFRPGDPEPLRGRDAIVSGWIAEQDSPDSWRFEFEVVGIMQAPAINEFGMDVPGDDTAVVKGVTEYLDERPTYDNLWLVTLDSEGRASRFTEWYMIRKGTGDAD